MTARLPDPPPSVARSAADILGDAAWLAHRFDPEADAVHFLHVPRALHDRATFLIDEQLPKDAEPVVIRRAEAMALAPLPAPIHFIFHSAFCCSTMLARAFDRPGWAVALKEPVILNDLVGWRRRGGAGPDQAEVLNDTLTLLARPFAQGEAVIVKPSNVIASLTPAMLALRPDARAVLLHAPLRTYLRSVAKKGLEGRLWVRTLLMGLLDDQLVDLGFSGRDHLGQTDLQVAAVGWLAQQALFEKLIARFGAERLRTLDSETLVANPAAVMARLADLFRLPADEALIQEVVDGPAFTRHSKLGDAFDASERAREHQDAAELHADEVEKVAIWAEHVATGAGITLTRTAPLIGQAAS
jgi:hypothetical protein